MAPEASEMNLCNIHTHTNAEHKGPGFGVFVSAAADGGFACNETPNLTDAELAPASGAYQGRAAPATRSRCIGFTRPATPPRAKGLAPASRRVAAIRSCAWRPRSFSPSTTRTPSTSPTMAYGGNVVEGRHQAKSLPSNTGDPVLFRGSTTGPLVRSAQLFPGPRDVERPAVLRQARHQLVAPLGGGRERLQRDQVARRASVGHGTGVACAHRVGLSQILMRS